MHTYALTGGIACGKSTLARLLAKAGWLIVDTDQIAHHLMEPEEKNWKNLVDAFGISILNSNRTINRRLLGDLVFNDPALRQKLNDSTHPAIHEAWVAERSYLQTLYPNDFIVVMIPLLFECGLQSLFTRTIAVGCSPASQALRLAERGFTPEQARMRMDSQLPVSRKLELCDIAFWNEGSLETLRQQLTHLI